MKYVSPEYEKQLGDLAERLVTPDRYGAVALADVIDLPLFVYPELPPAA